MKTYVNNVNAAVEGSPDEKLSMEELMLKSYNRGNYGGLFNNSAQVWNHDFYWESMKPNGGGKPSGKLLEAIESSFGSFDEFKKQFTSAGAPGPAFGSGWIWLVMDKRGNLKIEFTSNAENPLASGTGTPLLTYDVWVRHSIPPKTSLRLLTRSPLVAMMITMFSGACVLPRLPEFEAKVHRNFLRQAGQLGQSERAHGLIQDLDARLED